MNSTAKKLYNAIDRNINRVKDSYLATTAIGGGMAALYLRAASIQEKHNNKAAMVVMGMYAGYTTYLTGKYLLEKYQRDNRQASRLSKETMDQIFDLDKDDEKLDAELNKRTVETYKGYRIVVWDDYATLCTEMPADINFAVACIYKHKAIIMSNVAYEQKRDILVAIFEHEIGHIELGHISRKESEALQIEFEADEFALKRGVDILNALRKMRTSIFFVNLRYGRFMNNKSINQRIAKIKALG